MDKITFRSENGCCPYFAIDGLYYFLYECKNATSNNYEWQLRVKKSFSSKHKFYKNNPYRVLARFFKNKRHRKSNNGIYTTYFYNGLCFMTDGYQISIFYDYNLLGNFDTYKECLSYAKKYILKNHFSEQLSLF